MTKEKKPKKVAKYEKPKLTSFGKLADLSQTTSTGMKADGGAFPYDTKMCLTEPRAVEEYRSLIEDNNVQNVFRKCIFANVKPGDTVLDLGTGTGIHTLFALQAGAARVYAVDVNPVIHIAESIIREAGYADRVTFLQTSFQNLNVPEKVDVIIANLGFYGSLQNIPSVANRFLKQNGRLVPDSTRISFAPVCDQNFYDQKIGFWKRPHYNMDFSPMLKAAALNPFYLQLDREALVGTPFECSKLEFKDLMSRSGDWQMKFQFDERQTLHGIGGWYSFYSNDELMFSTKPPHELKKELWNNFILPLPEPLTIEANEILDVQVQFRFNESNSDTIWFWTVKKRASH